MRLHEREPRGERGVSGAGRLAQLRLARGALAASRQHRHGDVVSEKRKKLHCPVVHLLLSTEVNSTEPASSHLALVVGDASPPPPRLARRTPGCRPSELPTQVRIQLTLEALSRALEASVREGLSESLWVRIAVESQRQIERVRPLLGLGAAKLIEALDRAAARRSEITTLAAAPLAEYSRALAAPTSPSRGTAAVDGEFVLHLPDELLAAWSREAAAKQQPLGKWASEAVLAAPDGVAAWERAAARECCYLAEWILLEAASANRCSARPQR